MEISCKTDRLLLTTLSQNYSDKVLAFYIKNKNHFEPWEPDRNANFYSLPFQRLSLTMEQQLLQKNKLLRLWVFKKENPAKIIGSVNFYNITYEPFFNCQLGYKLDYDYTGMGYAFESVSAGIELFFENHPAIHRIEANIMPSNTSSIRLIEKLGFRYEGISTSSIRINHQWEDHYRFAYIKD